MSGARGDGAGRDRWAPLYAGLASGAILGLIAAVERTRHLRYFLSGPREGVLLFLTIAGWVLFAGLALGALATLLAGLARLVGRRLRLDRNAQALALGALLGAASAALALQALRLTVRFDGLQSRAPMLVLAAAAAGAFAGIVLLALSRTRLGKPRWRRGLALVVLLPAVAGLYLLDAYFAPGSSLGLHVIMDALVTLGAFLLALEFEPRFARARPLWLALVPAAVLFVHWSMTVDPNVRMLVRVRGTIAGRSADFFGWLSDFDRDGSAIPWLVAGRDARPFDPTYPGRIPGDQWPSFDPGTQPPGPGDPARAPDPGDARPHLVFVTLDACRWDAVPGAAWRSPRLAGLHARTPTLDSLVSHSARFAGGYAPSAGTEDTFLSLFSGLDLPAALGGVPEGRWLSERLVSAGYASRAFINEANFLPSPWGWPLMVRAPEHEGRRLAQDLVAFLAGQPVGRPAVAWYHLMDLHADVLNPLSKSSYSRTKHVEIYARALERVDRSLGELFSELRRRGLDRRTIVVIAADHGEEFGGHGHFHHNIAVYEPAIRVLFWATGPGIEAGPRPFAADVADVYPTFLAAAGVDPGATSGRSLWPAFADTSYRPEPRVHYSFLPQRGVSRRFSPYRHIERGQAAAVDEARGRKVILRFGREVMEVYDLARDPLESRNLARWRPAWADSLGAGLLERVLARPLRPGEFRRWF